MVIGFRHTEHQVGLAHLAALRKFWQAGIVGRIAFRHPGVHPCADGFDFLGTQDALAHKMTVVGIRRPRRHVPDGGHILYECTVGGHFIVCSEGHGTDLTGPVAFRAGIVDDRGHVEVIGDLGLNDANQDE